jgi:spore coat protein U-like protein
VTAYNKPTCARMPLAPSLIALAAVALALAPITAMAATDTDTMTVTATVIASCNVAADDLALGNYDPVAPTPLAAATAIDVICTNGTSYSIALDEGQGSGASVATRKMTSGANTLNYSLYQDASHTDLWGETQGVNTVDDTGTGAVQSFDVYGLVPAAQAAPAGAYSDTINVAVTY